MKKFLFKQSLTVNFLLFCLGLYRGKEIAFVTRNKVFKDTEQEDIDFFDIKVFYELKVWKNNECPLGWCRLQVPVENLNSCVLTHALVKHKLHWTQLYIYLLKCTCTLSKQNFPFMKTIFVLKSSAKSGVFCLKSFLDAVLALETTVIWR